MLALAHPEVPQHAPDLFGVGGRELYAGVLATDELRGERGVPAA